jgi:hypothetical protein
MTQLPISFSTQLWADFTAQRPEPDDGSPHGDGPVAVKIVDVLDEQWLKVLEIEGR